MSDKAKETIVRSVMSLMVSTDVEREVYERLRRKYEPKALAA